MENVKWVFFVSSEEDAISIYRDAHRLNLTGTGYVWIVTEQALTPPNVPVGKSSFSCYHVFGIYSVPLMWLKSWCVSVLVNQCLGESIDSMAA